MPGADHRFGGLPHPTQPRSREALDRLLAAGESLLEEHAFETASVSDIARKASSSVGSFYRLVGTKDLLLQAIHERFLTDSYVRLERELSAERFEGRIASTVVRKYVDLLVDVYARREGLLRALIIRSSAEPDFRAGVHRLNEALEEKFIEILAPHRRLIAHPRPREAMRFGVKVVLGALNQNTLAGRSHPAGSGGPEGAALARELTRVLCTYLALDLE